MTAKETANFVLDNLVYFNQNDKDNYLRRLIDLILKEDIETQALRAWKAKARPFLERQQERLEKCLLLFEAVDIDQELQKQEWTEQKVTLTELLGDSDERND